MCSYNICGYDVGRGDCVRLKGYFTVEATYIFAFIAFLVIAFIRLDYKLHDRVVNDSSKIQTGVRRYQAKEFYFDIKKGSIDYLGIIASPVIGEDENFINKMYKVIEEKQREYYYGQRLGAEDINLENTTDIINLKKNADVIRAGGRIVEVIGGAKDDG